VAHSSRADLAGNFSETAFKLHGQRPVHLPEPFCKPELSHQLKVRSEEMATGTSIVGQWDIYTDWGCEGSNSSGSSQIIFKENGSVDGAAFGKWIQVEGMVMWSAYFTSDMGLVYTANVSRNALVGIMGYISGSRSGSGCFYGIRSSSGVTSGASGATPTEQDATSTFGPEGRD
jgi:hypothetical protein